MFRPWYCADDDCGQYIRKSKNDKQYEMIQYVWLDRTAKDIENGLHEYVIVKTELNIDDVTDDDVLGAIGSYGYTVISLIERYGNAAIDIIAECIMEEEILRAANIIDDANSREEAEEKVEKYIADTQQND